MPQFNEKDMVNDYLSALNASLTGYASMIAQTDNEQLRQTLIQIRNADEGRQRAVYQYALQKGYYQPAQAATQTEVQQVRSQLSQPQ